MNTHCLNTKIVLQNFSCAFQLQNFTLDKELPDHGMQT